MVEANTKYLFTLPGLCKAGTLAFIIIAIGLGGHAYENSLYNVFYKLLQIVTHDLIPIPDELPGIGREKAFLALVGMIFIISIVLLVCHIMNEEFAYISAIKLADVAFHALGALLLIISGSLIIASSRTINKNVCNARNATESLFGQFVESPNDIISGTVSDFQTFVEDGTAKCQLRAEKEVAGTFAILGSLLFGFVAVIQFLRLNSPPPMRTSGTVMSDLN